MFSVAIEDETDCLFSGKEVENAKTIGIGGVGGGRSSFENNQSFPFPFFSSMVEFVQWFPHSFLKNHLLSQWDSGDFVLQPVRPPTATCYGFKNTRPILRSKKRGEDGVRRVFLIYKSSGCLTRPNVFLKEFCQEMELFCVPLNAAVEGSSERVHLELIKAVNYHFVYPAAQTWSALSKEKPVEEY